MIIKVQRAAREGKGWKLRFSSTNLIVTITVPECKYLDIALMTGQKDAEKIFAEMREFNSK